MKKTEDRNDFTIRLINKYIKQGMRVLDFGCGNGEVSFIIAKHVGENGFVDGIDINENAIINATEKKKELKIDNINFSTKKVEEINENKYDAIFGRRVLMYQNDPLDTINTLKGLLKEDGVMVFQESDEMATLLNDSKFSLHNRLQDAIWKTVKFEGGNTHIGSELYSLMKKADMDIIDYNSEMILQTIETGSDLSWVYNMMHERIIKANQELDIENIEELLKEEMEKANSAFIRDVAFGICAKNK